MDGNGMYVYANKIRMCKTTTVHITFLFFFLHMMRAGEVGGE